MDYGAWEGLTYEALERDHATARRRWEQAPDILRYPGGESGNDVAARVRDFLDEPARGCTSSATARPREQELPVLAVGHSSTNRILVCVALGHPDPRVPAALRARARRTSRCSGSSTATGPSDARLLVLNDIAHLQRAGTLPWA